MCIVPLLLLLVSQIQIDGSFADWSDEQVEAEDAHYQYKRVLLQPESCLQQLPEQLHVELGGYDIIFSPKDRGYGVSCSKDGETLSPYDIGLVFAPTTASSEFEIRINKPNTQQPTHSFDFTPQGVQVVSWNVQFGNLLDDVDRSGRILQALLPEILLLQELDGDDTPEKVSEFLRSTLGGTWTVHMSTVCGEERYEQLRSAIATRFPSTVVRVHQLPHKTVMANIEIGEHTITFISLHLRCCGGPTSEAETQRRNEASMIRNAINDLKSDGVIIAGDWNLVGTDVPLDTVIQPDLAIVEAYQIDDLLTATWSDTTSSFTPGRLDWMVFSKDVIAVHRGYVLDTSDLDSNALKANGLLSEDTAELSDHLPLVADIRIKSP